MNDKYARVQASSGTCQHFARFIYSYERGENGHNYIITDDLMSAFR